MAIHTIRTNSDDEETNAIHETTNERDTNWWPLLLIPLFLLVALAGVSAYQNRYNTGSGQSGTQPSVIQNNNEGITDPNSPQMGIGGAADEVSPTPTPWVMPTESTIPPISIAPPAPDTGY